MWPTLQNPCNTENHVADREDKDGDVKRSDESFGDCDAQKKQANRDFGECQCSEGLRSIKKESAQLSKAADLQPFAIGVFHKFLKLMFGEVVCRPTEAVSDLESDKRHTDDMTELETSALSLKLLEVRVAYSSKDNTPVVPSHPLNKPNSSHKT